jgi:hypothetical protein
MIVLSIAASGLFQRELHEMPWNVSRWSSALNDEDVTGRCGNSVSVPVKTR